MTHHLTRRHFLKAGAVAAVTVVSPLSARAASANGKLRTAHVGVGGMGMSDLKSLRSHPQLEVFALCDVDQSRLDTAAGMHPQAKTFSDFREMLAELGDQVDAVVVSTPDHTHAPAAMTALNLNKPVYCQKPLTHDVYESRRLREVADSRKVPTQMGIQVHSSKQYRQAVQIIQSGGIGKVSHVYVWCNKTWGYDGGPFDNFAPPPDSLAWDLWIGTAAERPYVPNAYHPGNWRKLVDFGCGTLGDMAVHILDTPFTALELTAPKWVKSTCRVVDGIGFPTKTRVDYEFPGTRYTTSAVKCTWLDGHMAPPKAEEIGLSADIQLPGSGAFLTGEEGMMLLPHVGDAVLFPETKFKDYRRPDVEGVSHYHQWVDACLGKGETSAPFSYGGPLTEALLLGAVGMRYPGQELGWDAQAMQITNLPEANRLLKREYRDGFKVEGL
ncbi:MAG TPA: Gfo/Idh/MocA family oxidoreductase [Planctomicrobium sp.]|nr:Gfo/Idh/MocA family oxidoreductase [Planctomicrobium sp.]